jgi:REP element-mobilizing transposase RayT
MARARKRHVQTEMAFPKRGGFRDGAGRPPKGERSSQPHKRRDRHLARNPVHATIRVVEDLGITLRRREMRLAIRWATLAAARHEQFRIVHFSIQHNHIHLLVEAEHKTALARGMQGFQISAAKHINRSIRERTGKKRKGGVFADRYHSRALTSPRAVRHALAYVLNNWRRHQEDRAHKARNWKLDPFSTAIDFPGWRELGDSPFLYRAPPGYEAMIVWRPRTWLLSEGWKRHGMISVYDVPGPMKPATKDPQRVEPASRRSLPGVRRPTGCTR